MLILPETAGTTAHEPRAISTLVDPILQRVRACARRHRVRVSYRLTSGMDVSNTLAAPVLGRIATLLRNTIPGVTPGTTLICTIAVIDGSVACRTGYRPGGSSKRSPQCDGHTIDEVWSWPLDATGFN